MRRKWRTPIGLLHTKLGRLASYRTTGQVDIESSTAPRHANYSGHLGWTESVQVKDTEREL